MKRALLFAALLAASCHPSDIEDDSSAEEASEASEAPEQTAEAQDALRTPGPVARYFHVSTGQALSLEEDYTTWSARWHTILRGRIENELFFYDRINGTAKTYFLMDDGTLVHENTQTMSAGVDIWVRGNFVGDSSKDLASYNRNSGVLVVYQIGSGGVLSPAFVTTVPAGGSLAFSGYWGNGAYDDIAFYDRSTGLTRYYRSTGSGFNLAHTSTSQKIWDHIVPGKFNSDAYTDLLYYNQDGGDVKVYTFNASYAGTMTYSATNWPITPYSVFAVGEFDGSPSTEEIVFYDPQNGWNPATTSSGASGRGRFYKSTGGSLSVAATQDWQKKWTHVIPIKQVGRSTHDLLFYSSSYDISVRPVLVSDSNGANPAQTTQAEFWRWLKVANETYRGAGIQFVWDGVFGTLKHTGINNYTCSNADSEQLKEAADSIAKNSFGAPDNVVIYIRTEDGGDGCASRSREYVIMPDFRETVTNYFHRNGTETNSLGGTWPPMNDNIKLLAHELGHYFGLAHTFYNSETLPSSLAQMDVDRSATGWTPVYDTSPAPRGAFWEGEAPECDGVGESCNGANYFRCDDTPAGEIPYPKAGGGSLILNPDRHNVMLSGVNCDFMYNLTPGQIDAVRKDLFGNRVELTD